MHIVIRARDYWAAKRAAWLDQVITGDINRRVHYAVQEQLGPIRRDIAVMQLRIRGLQQTDRRTGVHMSEIDDKLGEVDDLLNEVGDKVDDQAAEIKRLGDLLAQVDPADQAELERLRGEFDKAVNGLSGVATHLRAIASDPENPAPPAEEPTDPGDEGTGQL